MLLTHYGASYGAPFFTKVMKYKVIKDVVLQQVGDDCFIIPKKNKGLELTCCILLEGNGREIWESLNKNTDSCTVVSEISNRYEGDINEIAEDVNQILEVLIEADIIKEIIHEN